MKRTFDFYEIQVPFKFESIEECDRKISSLIEFIVYHAKKKKYFYQGVIISSEYKSEDIIAIKKVGKGQRGRPRIEKVYTDTNLVLHSSNPMKFRAVKFEALKRKVTPHIHMLFFLNPSATFAEIIRTYISKNWKKDSLEEFKLEKVHKRIKDVNITLAEYFLKQASTIRFINENHIPDIANFSIDEYNFRKYYSAYLDQQILLWGEYKNPHDRKTLEKSVLKYNSIVNFYNKHQKSSKIEHK